MTKISRVYNATDSLNPTMNPVSVSVSTDSSQPDTVTLTYTRTENPAIPDSACVVCQYAFDKADIQHLYDFLGDAISWLDYEDSQNGGGSTPTPPVVPVPPNSNCDTEPGCKTCPSSNIPTPPLGPYDPDFWPTPRH